MKIIIPALPSDYARPYPELVLEGTETQMSTLANMLSGLDRSNPRGICARVTGKPGGQLLIKAIEPAPGRLRFHHGIPTRLPWLRPG